MSLLTVSSTAQLPSQFPSNYNRYGGAPILDSQQSICVSSTCSKSSDKSEEAKQSAPLLTSQQSMEMASARSEEWEQWFKLPQPELSTAIYSPLPSPPLDFPFAQHPSSSDMEEEMKQSAPLSESERLCLTQLHFKDYHEQYAPLEQDVLPQDKKEPLIMKVGEFSEANSVTSKAMRKKNGVNRYKNILLDPLRENVDSFKRKSGCGRPYSEEARNCVYDYYIKTINLNNIRKTDIYANIALHTGIRMGTIKTWFVNSA